MLSEAQRATHVPSSESEAPRKNLFSAADVVAILRERNWLVSGGEVAPRTQEWMTQSADYLGPHCGDRAALEDLFSLVFHYDAAQSLATPASHATLTREGARDVIRELAREILSGVPVDSDRFKAIIDSLKQRVTSRSRHLFHPIRLALAGRAGEGELDRVILLLDSAAIATGLVQVKSTRQRMLEFCAALS